MKINKKRVLLLIVQLAVWAFVLMLPPLAVLVNTGNPDTALTVAYTVLRQSYSPLLLYFVNFYLLEPRLFAKRRYLLFSFVNAIIYVIANHWIFYIHTWLPYVPENATFVVLGGIFVYFLFNVAVVSTAVFIRHFVRTNEIRQRLKEEKAKNAEAELAWLKSQINPHFLFNTLNNISGLVRVDVDEAQEAIAALSDLLRYALYETSKKYVSLGGEVEFIKNYMELMKLRLNERAKVEYSFEMQNDELNIAPLLFIPLVENAFKHGISSNRPSRISVSLVQNEEKLIFTCDNTCYPKSDAGRDGSGIGVENTRRRMELIYNGRYEWEQSLVEGIYHVCVKIRMQ